MSGETADGALTIAQLAQLAGVSAGTLRMWETRHGFPVPRRTPRGHRRYDRRDVERVQRVAADRDAGMSLALAIRRVQLQEVDPGDVSMFAGLRRLHPHLEPHLLTKRAMLALSVAIEDECMASAERPLLYAAFQHERFYRAVQRRWRELARTAEAAFVFADFGKLARPRGAPVEVPIEPGSVTLREWSVVCDSPGYAVCLAGWERPGRRAAPDSERRFEALWSLEPEVARQAAVISNARVQSAAPQLASAAAERLRQAPAPAGPRELRVAAALTGRMAAYLSEGPSDPG